MFVIKWRSPDPTRWLREVDDAFEIGTAAIPFYKLDLQWNDPTQVDRTQGLHPPEWADGWAKCRRGRAGRCRWRGNARYRRSAEAGGIEPFPTSRTLLDIPTTEPQQVAHKF